MATATPPPSPPPPPPPADFWTVLSESQRILKAHSRHFLALSVLFLLPLSFCVAAYPTLHRLLLSSFSSSSSSDLYHAQALLRRSPLLNQPAEHHQSSVDASSVLVSVGYSCFLTLLSICATCSITYSVVQGFYGRPVKLPAAIKSIGTSFFPLLATLICTQAITSSIVIGSGILGFLILKGAELAIGHEISYSSPYFLGLAAAIAVALVLMLAYLQVQWGLVNVVVVAELSYGFAPLRRSAYLVKGMRGVALSLTLFFGVLSGFVVCIGTLSTSESVIDGNEWRRWYFVAQIVSTSSCLTVLMQLSLAATVVLYMYCKALHGELAIEIAEEFAREYVSLPFDDEKVLCRARLIDP
ncbi:uncharacterized protein LOC104453921 [Eucalyptus grandis]|uniref:uncharacterized protein LOC104453921 n=1 Tax=Eucalyptus grandis TaxID=71139 RepID=UPI00192EB06C|nr:uncharacterized protein LOC104453921 [Eucalyptus grandis]